MRDRNSGTAFSRSESSSGPVTKGSYRVALPDGRVQIVTYVADDGGYKASVTYEGEPVYPKPEEYTNYAGSNIFKPYYFPENDEQERNNKNSPILEKVNKPKRRPKVQSHSLPPRLPRLATLPKKWNPPQNKITAYSPKPKLEPVYFTPTYPTSPSPSPSIGYPSSTFAPPYASPSQSPYDYYPSTTAAPVYRSSTFTPVYEASTIAQRAYPSPTARAAYQSTTARQHYPSTTARPQYPSTTSRPQYPSTTAGHIYQSSTAQPVYQSTTARSTYPSTTVRPQYPSTTAKPAFPSTTYADIYESSPTHESYHSNPSEEPYQPSLPTQEAHVEEEEPYYNPSTAYYSQSSVKPTYPSSPFANPLSSPSPPVYFSTPGAPFPELPPSTTTTMTTPKPTKRPTKRPKLRHMKKVLRKKKSKKKSRLPIFEHFELAPDHDRPYGTLSLPPKAIKEEIKGLKKSESDRNYASKSKENEALNKLPSKKKSEKKYILGPDYLKPSTTTPASTSTTEAAVFFGPFNPETYKAMSNKSNKLIGPQLPPEKLKQIEEEDQTEDPEEPEATTFRPKISKELEEVFSQLKKQN